MRRQAITTGCPKSTPKVPKIFSERVANYYLAQYDRDISRYECAARGEIFNAETLDFEGCADGSENAEKAGLLRNEVRKRND